MIVVSKNENEITFFNDGRKLVISKEKDLFEELKEKSKEELIVWFKGR